MNWITRAKTILGRSPRSGEAPWGDGLVEEGFGGLAGPTDWSKVDADELLFLIPGLRPGSVLPPMGRERLLPQVQAARLRLEKQDRRDVLGRASRAVLARCGGALAGEAPDWSEAGLVEAGIVSFEAGINGAYVLGSAELLGDTMAACAWAGMVCSGRDALLAPVLAPALADMVAAGGVVASSGAYSCLVSLMRRRLDEAHLVVRLERALRSLGAGGRLPLVRGARPHAPQDRPLPAGLEAALASIAAWPHVRGEAGRASSGAAG